MTVVSVPLGYWSYRQHREAKIATAVENLNSDDNTGPLYLIRTINELQSLGHGGAVEALDRYFKGKADSGFGAHHAITKLDLFIPLLFKPKDRNAKLPSPDWDRRNLTKTKNRYVLSRDSWGSTFQIVDGIPFDTEWGVTMSTGFRSENTYLIEWAKHDGVIRNSTLTPSSSPFFAAQKLADELVGQCTDRNEDTELETDDFLNSQVLDMIKHLIPDSELPSWGERHRNNEKMQHVIGMCTRRGLTWDAVKQTYTFSR